MRFVTQLALDFCPMLGAIFVLGRFGSQMIAWVHFIVMPHSSLFMSALATIAAYFLIAAAIQFAFVRLQQRYLPTLPKPNSN